MFLRLLSDDVHFEEERSPNDVAGEVEVITFPNNDPPSQENSLRPNTSRRWKKTEEFDSMLSASDPPQLIDSHPYLITMNAIEIFGLYFTPEYVGILVDLTNRYAHQKGSDFRTNADEMLLFFGLLLSGYHKLPTEDSYWSTSSDLACPIASESMSRDRFRKIKRFIHFADNCDLNQNDKYAKIRPLYDHLNQRLQQFGVFEKDLSIDESMVPYYGMHSGRMFIKGKPVRFGYKIWALCSKNGYPFNLQLYAGASDRTEEPLGQRVTKQLAAICHNPCQHTLTFDNFFTSYQLMEELTHMGFRATGTVKDNRTNRCPLNSKEMKKKEKGTMDWRGDGQLLICQWNDNAVVKVCSNHLPVHPTTKVKRWIKKDKRFREVQQPYMITQYNRSMGGVDTLDRLLASYRPVLRSKKWYLNLFSNALNLAVVASWRVHQASVESRNAKSHLDFRRSLTVALLKSTAPVMRSRRGGPTAPIFEEIRFDGHGHFISKAESQGRCAFCQRNTTKKCSKCGKRLHEACFQTFHSNQM